MSSSPPEYPLSTRLPAPPARRLRVVVTGATGYIASQLLPAFRPRYDLVLLDVRTTDRYGREVEGVQIADLLADDWRQHRRHFRGADAAVHLAYYRPPATGVSGAGKEYLDERPNVDMAERVYRLALEENVRRVVVASSNHAADWYEHLIHQRQIDQIGPADLPKSDNYYGWAKIAYEALGFVWRWCRSASAPRARSKPARTRAAPSSTSATWAPTSARGTSSSSSSAPSRPSASKMSGASPSRSSTASPTTPAPSGASPTPAA
jgi:hypothetical protein